MGNMETSSFDRRDFLKAMGAIGSVAVLGSAAAPNVPEAQAKTYDDIYEAYHINMDEFERYDAARTAFSIQFAVAGMEGAPALPDPLYQPLYDQLAGINVETPFKAGDPGYTQLDYALAAGSNTVQLLSGSVFVAGARHEGTAINFENEQGELIPISMYGNTSESFVGAPPHAFDVAEERFEFESPEAAAYAVKKAAKLYGADLVGIAPYDENFIYKSEPYMPRDKNFALIEDKIDFYKPVDFGFEPKSVIVMALEMDYEAMKCQATQIEMAATQIKYSQMIEVSLSLANFLRKLGYNTCHSGNGKSPSVAEAIRAGLGEGNRMTILMTEEFGPRVRLCKVYTDLECAYDKPKTFGVTEFCEVCQVCADSCPSEAITHLSIDDPENKPFDSCQQGGIRKYYLDSQKCLYNWFENIGGNDCGVCISVCPYNKPQTWNHDLCRIITRIPGLNSLARYFDEFFGYGGIRDGETISNFWKKTI